MRLLTTAFLVLVPLPVLASGTFCVGGVAQSPQCIYDDVTSCIRAADPPVTACLVSQTAVLGYVGGGRYCTVGSERMAQCLYVDRSQCNAEAIRSGNICIDRNAVADETNPFRYDTRVQN